MRDSGNGAEVEVTISIEKRSTVPNMMKFIYSTVKVIGI